MQCLEMKKSFDGWVVITVWKSAFSVALAEEKKSEKETEAEDCEKEEETKEIIFVCLSCSKWSPWQCC